MGKIKKILSEVATDSRSWFSPTLLSIELAESFHIHLRNLRIELDKEEFKQFCESIIQAYANWSALGEPDCSHGPADTNAVYLNSQTGLSGQTIKPVPGITPTKLRLEEQVTNGLLHLHWRNIRLDLGKEEFEQLKKAVDVKLE